MTYADFYNKLVELSLFAPTDGVINAVLDLQLALDNITNSDDDVGIELQEALAELFE
jgi:flagellar motor component MotA